MRNLCKQSEKKSNETGDNNPRIANSKANALAATIISMHISKISMDLRNNRIIYGPMVVIKNGHYIKRKYWNGNLYAQS